tara:strand:- start:12670 stop:13149 length:480 start_codon:yes stop_codon:yes gene_type:complete
MKQVGILILSLLISHSIYSNDIAKDCRDYYYGVCLNEVSIKDFDSYLGVNKGKDQILIKGYQAVIWFLWADYYVNPIQKWKCFNKGKKNLDFLIDKNKNNAELRFLRLTIQDNLPKFLGYSNKKEDTDFIYNQLNKITDKDLQSRIVNYLCYNSMNKTN